MKVAIFRRDNGQPVKDEAVRAYFQRCLQQETREIDSCGTQWPNMRAARPEWFEQRR